ncbi:sterol carrier family protein [Propionibacteriaceae bacterium G1746]|uniref:sterol carrier family protein n=1 Tax=Aestuariimicrobium sp. G57 TaxID=3418485 RepID=UPI003C1BF1D0
MAAASDQTLRRVATAFIDQIAAVIPDATRLGSAQLPASTAREQCGQVLFLLTDALQTVDCPSNTRPGSLSDHLADRHHAEKAIRDVIRSVIGHDTADLLMPQARRLLIDLRARLLTQPVPAIVESLFGTVRFVDYLRGALVEAVALGLRFRCEVLPVAASESARALATVLTARHPGGAIELRVPPAVAVQLGAFGEGPQHTRGTPPNVVETDAVTFVALATGLREYGGELARHTVSASGAHAGAVARMLPVINLMR